MTDQIAKFEAAEEILRGVTRTAHEATKDLRLAIREGRALVDEIHAAAQVAVDARLEPIVTAEVTKLGEATEAAMREAVDKVGREFDKLEAMYLGEDKASRRAGRESIRDLTRRAAHRE